MTAQDAAASQARAATHDVQSVELERPASLHDKVPAVRLCVECNAWASKRKMAAVQDQRRYLSVVARKKLATDRLVVLQCRSHLIK